MFNYSIEEIRVKQTSPIDPFILNLCAGFLIITFFLCFFCNSYLLIAFIRFKDLRCSLNLLIITITVSNLSGSFQFPPIIYSYSIRK